MALRPTALTAEQVEGLERRAQFLAAELRKLAGDCQREGVPGGGFEEAARVVDVADMGLYRYRRSQEL